MSFLRYILSFFVIIVDSIFKPSIKVLSDKQKALLAKRQEGYQLYQFKNCPFCVKVRWEMRRLGLIDIPLKDAKNNSVSKAELLTGGGKVQVPCLRIENKQGKVKWLYESADIIDYLRQQFS